MIDVSIIVPVYNVEAWIPACLESLVNQTHKSIEIICVDDGSTDESVAVIQRYMERDARIKLIQQQNSGTVIARKRAVEHASGKYFLFVDPDDYLDLSACERLSAEMDKRKCDILQFGVEIHETKTRTEEQRQKSQTYFNPKPIEIKGETIFTACYLESRLSYNIIFRCFSGDLVRKAFSYIPDVFSINETDVFAFFFISFFARHFVAISDKYYHYRYGVGISTKSLYGIKEFKRVLRKIDTLKVMKSFVSDPARNNATTTACFKTVRDKMIANACSAAIWRMDGEMAKREGFAALREKVGDFDVLKYLISKYRVNQPGCANLLRDLQAVCSTKLSKLNHVGIFYYHMSVGGIQRVVQKTIEGLISKGTKVTLILEKQYDEHCYQIPDGVAIKYLPACTWGNEEQTLKRLDALKGLLDECGFDVVYSHAYMSTTMLWDILACKWLGKIPFVLHYHTLFTVMMYLNTQPKGFVDTQSVLKLCDRVVCVSRVDSMFFNSVGIPAIYIQNPIAKELKECAEENAIPEFDKHKIVWVGRFSWEKQPTEAIHIFAKIRLGDPKSRLVMVGGGDGKVCEDVRKKIAELSLEDSVELAGEQLDVYPFYRDAAMFLTTSLLEGFGLTSLEALCNGLPIVAYANPQLELYRDNPAVFQVAQKSQQAAADAALRILQSGDKLAGLH